ncbi:unnamed protein product, partial [Laminaria digitata]
RTHTTPTGPTIRQRLRRFCTVLPCILGIANMPRALKGGDKKQPVGVPDGGIGSSSSSSSSQAAPRRRSPRGLASDVPPLPAPAAGVRRNDRGGVGGRSKVRG